MKCMIVFVLAAASLAAADLGFPRNFAPLAPPPVVLANGHLADTPEVAAAKANFHNEYNRALINSGNAAPAPFSPSFAPAPAVPAPAVNYRAEFAPPGSALNPDGTLANTYEVSKATAEHLRQLAISQGQDSSPWDNYLRDLNVYRSAYNLA